MRLFLTKILANRLPVTPFVHSHFTSFIRVCQRLFRQCQRRLFPVCFGNVHDIYSRQVFRKKITALLARLRLFSTNPWLTVYRQRLLHNLILRCLFGFVNGCFSLCFSPRFGPCFGNAHGDFTRFYSLPYLVSFRRNDNVIVTEKLRFCEECRVYVVLRNRLIYNKRTFKRRRLRRYFY